MTKRFVVQTKSGSLYLIEDHTHLFKSPTWKIIDKNQGYLQENFIVGLMLYGGEDIPAQEIKNIKQFKEGYQIIYHRHNGADMEGPGITTSSKIKRVFIEM